MGGKVLALMEILSISLVETNRKTVLAKEWKKAKKLGSSYVRRHRIQKWDIWQR